MGKSILKDYSFKFALEIIKLYKNLVISKKEFVLSKQLLKSGTSVGAMIREAKNAESKNDFIHKLAIAQKECDETMYWLELLQESDYVELKDFTSIHDSAYSLLKMIRSSILTIKQKANP
ncbi:MAG TPA: four helix bundle protein [Puia sp.]|jgi:four helix bundle protein|nr:four helix bundle protein [Puia sp.]